MEQREMSQMRQGAILQRKLDATEQQLREVRQRRDLHREEADRARLKKQQAEDLESDQRCKETARVLETELQQRLEVARHEAQTLEKSVRSAQAHRIQLQSDV